MKKIMTFSFLLFVTVARSQTTSFPGDVHANGSIFVDGGDLLISRQTFPYGYVARPDVAGFRNLQFAVAGGGPLDNLALNSHTSFFTGNVGIFTESPTAALDVRGDIYAKGMLYVDGGDVYIKRTTTAYGYVIRPDQDGYRNLAFAVTGGGQLDNLQMVSKLSTFSGKVGIGTAELYDYSLAVNGSAIFTRVVVKPTASWPDYVFKKNYSLPSLRSVERYITAHQHLPGMPSADSVEKSGLEVGSGQALLLKKIEELTLYVIRQNKELEAQRKRIGQLEKAAKGRR